MNHTEEAVAAVEAAIARETKTTHFGGWVRGAQLALHAYRIGGEDEMRLAGFGIGYVLEQGYTWAARKITLGIVEDLGWGEQ
jgi:hypothetical protein